MPIDTAHDSLPPHNIKTGYLQSVMDPLAYPKTLAKAHKMAKLIMEARPFDTIVFTGMSGAAIGFALAQKMKVAVLVVRKESDNTHYSMVSSKYLEGNIALENYLIVDDFVDTGNSVNRMVRQVRSGNKSRVSPTCVGVLQYTRLSYPAPTIGRHWLKGNQFDIFYVGRVTKAKELLATYPTPPRTT